MSMSKTATLVVGVAALGLAAGAGKLALAQQPRRT